MDQNRNIYLKMKTLTEAKKILFDSFKIKDQMPYESIVTVNAVGRILAEPVFAQISSPNFHAAAMDGIAVKADITFGVNEAKPKTLKIGEHAFYINTGHVMPKDTDAVIMIEHIQVGDDKNVIIEAPVFPWQNVRKMGEDIVATQLLFPRHHKITSYSIGALLSAGLFSVLVIKKPKLLIIPTGSELVEWSKTSLKDLKPGQVIETNSFVLGESAKLCGACYVRHEKVMDDMEKIKLAVSEALSKDFDMILIVGGSSAGSEDYARGVIASLGDILVHGVSIMPGKPLIIGAVNEKPVFGIPGYPVSAIIAFEQFVSPLIYRMLGQDEELRQTIRVEPTRKIASKLGIEEFLRVKLGQVGNRIVATPLPRGAGSITTITEADGIIRIPDYSEGIKDDDAVFAELLRPLHSIKNTIVIVGSHDNTLDILADHIRSKHDNITISSSHVGSMGGLMAVKGGVCHIAGTHLLNTDDGSYNISYIRKYLPDKPVYLINLVFRDQGLIIPKKNPKNIIGIEDLRRQEIRLINRQAGSGTRILLDYRLKELNIKPKDIQGYENEEFTHMSVAVAVLSGAADVGLGIFAAAKALGLDFIPVVTEQYDLVIPEEYFNAENICVLLDTIRSSDFKKRVEALGGYHTNKTGEIIMSPSSNINN
jgi:putative molybdopterin biosynthesis protein